MFIYIYKHAIVVVYNDVTFHVVLHANSKFAKLAVGVINVTLYPITRGYVGSHYTERNFRTHVNTREVFTQHYCKMLLNSDQSALYLGLAQGAGCLDLISLSS